MKRLLPLFFLIGLMLWGVPVQAELTGQEKLQVKTLLSALGPVEASPTIPLLDRQNYDIWNLQGMLISMIYAVEHNNGWTPELQQAYLTGVTIEGLLETSMTRLLHANPYLASSTVYATLEQRSVAQWVQDGQDQFLLAQQYLTVYLKQQIQAARSVDPEHLDMAEKQRKAVAEKMAQVNLTSSFTAWQPADFPQIIGPHGDYKAAIDELAFAMANGLGLVSNVSAHPFLLPKLETLATFSMLIQNQIRHALLKVAMIPMNPTTCAMNRFHLVADSIRHILAFNLSGLARGNKNNLVDIAREFRGHDIAEFEFILQTIAYQWSHADNAIWNIMIFPDPTKHSTLQDQAPTDLGAPLC